MTDKPSAASPARLMHDLALLDPLLHDTVQAVRQLVQRLAPGTSEAVKYGGIMFTAPGASAAWGGVYAYRQHVSLEFSKGHAFADPHGVLEGAGRFRRHIQLTSPGDLEARQVGHYVAQASPALSRP